MKLLSTLASLRMSPVLGETWMIILFSFCLIVIATVRIAYPKRLLTLFHSFFNYRTLSQIIKEEGLFARLPSMLTILLFFISGALFLYEIDTFFQLHVFYELESIALYMMYLLLLFVVYFIRWILIEVLKHIFNDNNSIESYFYTTMQFNKVLGIFLLLLGFITAFVYKIYVLPILWVGFTVSIALYLYRIFTGFRTGLKEGVSFFYLFLYLCALEISPAIVFAKLLITKL